VVRTKQLVLAELLHSVLQAVLAELHQLAEERAVAWAKTEHQTTSSAPCRITAAEVQVVRTAVQFPHLPQGATVREQQAARAEAVLQATVPVQSTRPGVTEQRTPAVAVVQV
jgi:hypothetical protein